MPETALPQPEREGRKAIVKSPVRSLSWRPTCSIRVPGCDTVDLLVPNPNRVLEITVTDQTSVVFFSQRLWCTVGAALAALAVVLGAFGAHLLDPILLEVHRSADPKVVAGLEVPAAYKYLHDFKTAATYQMTHALAIILVGLLGRRGKARFFAHGAAGCFLGGIVLFSGTLYLLSTTGVTWLGAVAPIGGLLFIVGWILFATAAAMPRTRY